MSDNPFADPPKQPPVTASASPHQPPATGGQSLPPAAPGALTPILVFCLIFGILGWLGNCFGGAGLLLIGMIENIIDQAQMPEAQAIFTKLSMSAQQPVMLPSIILLVINVVIATMLIIGAIGCFKRKESSRGVLRLALLAAIIFSVCKAAVTIYGYVASQSLLTEGVEKHGGEPIYDELKAQLTMNQTFAILGPVFVVVVALAMMGFYFWARSYLGKPEVEQHFADVARYKAGN